MSRSREAMAMILDLARLVEEKNGIKPGNVAPAQLNHRIEELADRLRDIIEGAAFHAAPASPPDAAAESTSEKKQVSARAVQVAPARGNSGYTPPTNPPFLETYYETGLRPATLEPGDRPRGAVSAGGDDVGLSHNMKVLLGLETEDPTEPQPRIRADGARRAVAPTAAVATTTVSTSAANASANDTAPQQHRSASLGEGKTVIVHLLRGGVRRGRVRTFSPDGKELELWPEQGQQTPERILQRDVLVVFFGPEEADVRGGPSQTAERPHSSTHEVIVHLVNGKAVRGKTHDYEPGRAWMTVVPNERRPGIDYVWIPAWAVESLEIDGPP